MEFTPFVLITVDVRNSPFFVYVTVAFQRCMTVYPRYLPEASSQSDILGNDIHAMNTGTQTRTLQVLLIRPEQIHG